MDVQQFEQAILRLAFETDARISTASVAYYLGIPSRKANELLNALLEEGVLELDSDPEGNLYYRVPHKPEGNDGLLPRLRREQNQQVDAHPRTSDGPGERDASGREQRRAEQAAGLSSSVMLVSADQDDDSEPISPGASSPRRAPGDHPQNSTTELARLAGRRPQMGPADPDSGWQVDPGGARASQSQPRSGRRGPNADGWNEPRQPRVRARRSSGDLFAGLTRRQAQPDASLDRCGASPVVVSDAVRCDPQPLPSRKPVVASCVEPHARQHQWHQNQWASAQRQGRSEPLFDRAQSQATMLAPTASGDLAMRDDQLERPEHQPGMALLLSLILCGTGQIYNGEVSKGIMMMVLCFLLWFVLLGWVVHIWSIVDSVVVAERLNRKAG